MVRAMPILRGSVTFARFRVEHAKKPPSDVRRWLARGLESNAFEPIDRRADDDRSAGFVELEDHDATGFAPGDLFYGPRVLFCWRIDQLRVPAGQLRAELEQWAKQHEREHDRKPSRSERTQAKAAIREKLRSRAEPVTRTHDLAWDVEGGQLQIWATSRKVVDEITEALATSFDVALHARTPSGLGDADEAPLKPTLELVTGLEEVSHGAA